MGKPNAKSLPARKVCAIGLAVALAAFGTSCLPSADIQQAEAKTVSAKPKIGTCKLGAGKATVTWKKIAGARKYQVRWAAAPNMAKAKRKTVGSRKLTIGNLTAGKKLYVQVRAKTGGKWSKWSKSRKYTVKTPNTPVLAPPRSETHGAGLTWNGSRGATGYQIRWSAKASMDGASYATSKSRSYDIKNLTAGKKTYVQVRAYRKSCKSPWSAVRTAVPAWATKKVHHPATYKTVTTYPRAEATENARMALSAASADQDKAQDALDAANAEAAKAKQVMKDRESDAQAAKEELAAAKEGQSEAKAKQAELKLQKNKGSIGFFESVGATSAVELLKNAPQAACTYTVDGCGSTTKTDDANQLERDATSLTNMKKTFNRLREGNALRIADNHFGINGDRKVDGEAAGAMKVTDYLMAAAQSDANADAVAGYHCKQFWNNKFYQLRENLSTNRNADYPRSTAPYSVDWDDFEQISALAGKAMKEGVYTGWYTREKEVYDYKLAHPNATDQEVADALDTDTSLLETGHYLFLTKYYYDLTGYAISRNRGVEDTPWRNGAETQEFFSTDPSHNTALKNESLRLSAASDVFSETFTIDEYEARFDAYCKQFDDADQAVEDATQAVKEKQETADAAQEALEAAQKSADAAEAKAASAQDSLDDAQAAVKQAQADLEKAAEEDEVATEDVVDKEAWTETIRW